MKKNAQIANFNVVFGDEEKPMLDYFDTIIYPAFNSDITKKSDDNEFMFKNIEIASTKDVYVLTGKIVKKTELEIKTDLNEKGELVEKDEKYSTAPYSSFAINLMNHRMIFMPNQKGSPTLANFRRMVAYVFLHYIKQENKKEEHIKKYDEAIVNIVGIPGAKSMDELLDKIEKINTLTLRFYPLNGDMDYSEAFGILATEVRNEVGCKNGDVVYKSPKSISGIKNVLKKAAGTINPIIKGITKNNGKITLKDYELSEKYEIEIDDDATFEDESRILVNSMDKIETLQFSSEKHNEIYDRNKEKIVSFIERKGDLY